MCLVEHFPKIVNGHKPFGASSKSCFIDAWQGPKYATVSATGATFVPVILQ